MSENQTIDQRFEALQGEVRTLLVSILALGADSAREGEWVAMQLTMSAAEHLEAARQALSKPRGGVEKISLKDDVLGAGGGTGQIDPPPTGGDDQG